jgi:hypothetical protein
MVVRGLIEKPDRIDTPLGTLAEAGNYIAPRLARRLLHQLYLGYPDSAAARGVAPAAAAQPPRQSSRRPKRPARAISRVRVPRPVKRAVRLVPGVYW